MGGFWLGGKQENNESWIILQVKRKDLWDWREPLQNHLMIGAFTGKCFFPCSHNSLRIFIIRVCNIKLMPGNLAVPLASELRKHEALECFPFHKSPILAWRVVESQERKEQFCPCGGYGLSLRSVWAPVGYNSSVCNPPGSRRDASGVSFVKVRHRGTAGGRRQGWWSKSWSQHGAEPGWEGGLLGSGAGPTDAQR